MLDYVFAVVPEALSRLVTKCDCEIFDNLVDLLIALYCYDDISALKTLKHLVSRTIGMMPLEILKSNLPKFWEIDIIPDINDLPDPFNYIYMKMISHERNKSYKMIKEQETKFCIWLERAKEKKYEKNALSRLLYIYAIYRLPKKLENKLKKILWDKNNLDEYGLPNLGVFYKVLAIDYPHDIDDIDLLDKSEKYVVDLYQHYIREKLITDYKNLFNMTMIMIEKSDNISEKKACKAFKLLNQFCEMVASRRKSAFEIGFFNGNSTLNKIDEIVGSILLKSKMVDSDKGVHNKDINQIVRILDSEECPHALISWCISNEKDKDEGILSSALKANIAYAQNANQAIYHLIYYGIEISGQIITLMIDSVVTTFVYYLHPYVMGLELLIRKGLLNEAQCARVADALPKFDIITAIDLSDDDDDFIKKLGMRKVVSMLALSLFKWYEGKGKSVPKGVIYWKKISKNPEEFAEIRLVWEKD